MSTGSLSRMDHKETDKDDRRYLVQPRGPGKSWVFRMLTPPDLIGLPASAVRQIGISDPFQPVWPG